MIRHTKWWLLLSALAIATVEANTYSAHPSWAQDHSAVISCNPQESLQDQISTALEEARTTLDRENWKSLNLLQDGLSFALQIQNPQIRIGVLQQWLLDTNEGYPITRFQRLMQLVDGQQAAQLQTVLDQFLQLTNRITVSNSYVKTRALAAIAHHYARLDRPQRTMVVLEQARQAANGITGDIFTANALIDVAESYAAIDQPELTTAVLSRIEQALHQVPPNTSESIEAVILERMAATYAQVGDYTNAQRIAVSLPENSDSRSIALEKIVEAYLAEQNIEAAEQLIQTITAPAQQVRALTHLAVAYHDAEQSEQATQLLQRSVQLAQSEEIALNSFLKDALIKELITAHLHLGQREDALKLAQTSLPPFHHPEAFKAIMIALNQAGQDDVIEQFLSNQLSTIRSTSDEWEQQQHLGELLELAVVAQHFEWIRNKWNQIAPIYEGQIVDLAAAHARIGDYSDAVQWVEQLPLDARPSLQIKLLATIALTAHQAGDTEWANQLLQQTLQRIDPMLAAYQERLEREGGDVMERDQLKPYGLANVAVVYAQMGQPDVAHDLLQQVIQLDKTMSDPSIASPIDNPFALFIEAEQYTGALQLAQATRDPSMRESRLQTVAAGLLKQNRFDLVLPIVDQLTEASPKTQLLLAIAQRYATLQQTNQALPILAQAFQVAQTIPGDESQVDRFGTDGLTVVESDRDRGSLLEAIALQYAKFQQLNQALTVANTLQDPQTRQQAIQRIQCVSRR